MKKLFSFAILFLSTQAALGQIVPPDSLNYIIQNLSPFGQNRHDDTLRIHVLITWAETVHRDDDALRIWGRILNLSEAAKEEKAQMIANSRLGFYYGRKGQYYHACEYLFTALLLAEKFNDTNLKSYTLRLLGDFHLELGQHAKAASFYKKALLFLSKKNNPSLYLLCQNNLGLVYFSQKYYQAAIKQFLYCIEENLEIKDKNITNYCLVNLAACYREVQNYGLALESMKEFRKSNTKNQNDLAFADSQTARIYLAMGKWDTALRFAKTSYKSQHEIKGSTLEDINEVLYLIYKNKGQNVFALKHLEEFNGARLANEQDMRRKQIEALRFSYENEKQKENILELNKSMEHKKTEQKLLAAGLLFFILLGSLLVYNNKLLHRKNVEIEKQKNQIDLVKEELFQANHELMTLNDTLEERVNVRTMELTNANEELIRKNREIQEAFYNGQSLERKRVASELHDNLGSTLSGLKWQLESLDGNNFSPKERTVYSRVLSKMEEAYSEIRLISHNLLPEELESKGLSIAIQNLIRDLNRNNRIVFSCLTDYQKGTLDKKGEMELYSICLELINNIIKHSDASEAAICFRQMDNLISVTVSDNGKGFTEEILEERNNNGLKNIRNRASTINGRLSITTTVPHGTVVYLEVKLNGIV